MNLHDRIRVAQNCLHRNSMIRLDYRETRELNQKIPGNFIGSLRDNAALRYHGNQLVNHIAERYVVNLPTIGGEPHNPKYIGLVNYTSLRGEAHNLCGTKRPMQNKPEIIGSVESITRSNPVQPFGSMPALRNFSRHASLIHELKLPGLAAESICCKRESSSGYFSLCCQNVQKRA